MAKRCINQKLYETRLSLGLDKKQASKLLHITKLHLHLIEKGYLQVSKKLEKRFIEVYNLHSNFFTTNYNYTGLIDKPIDSKKQTAKFKSLLAKPALRWTSLGLVAVNLGMLGYGIYCLARPSTMPTAAWSGDFKQFWTNMKKEGQQSPSILYPGDTKYTVTGSKEVEHDDGYCEEAISTFGQEVHVVDTTMQAYYHVTKDNQTHPIVAAKSKFTFDVFVYNKKKIILSSFQNANWLGATFTITNAIGVLEESGLLSFRPFTYYQNGLEHTAKEDSGVYKEFSLIFNEYLIKAYQNFNKIFKDHNLVYTSAVDLISDLKVISRDQILHFRMGIWFTILGTIFAVGFALILSLSFYFYYQFRKKGTFLEKSVKQLEPKLIKMPPKMVKLMQRDMKSVLVIPEFVLTIIGLLILAFSQVVIYISITYWFKSTMTFDVDKLKNFSSNLLIAGVALLFFVKLDTYTQKSMRQLLISIFIFIFGGIAFYVAECVLYVAFSGGNDILSIVFKFLSSLLPGNFVWPLALYAALFLFLFTTPEKIKNDIHKINNFRLCSLIPTFLLLFSLIWQFVVKPNAGVNIPYYVQFLFFSKGATLTAFVLIYVYVLYFFQRYCKKRLGVTVSKDFFFYSKRYFFNKNAIAAITLGGLLIVELCFKFLYPNNSFGMGNSWAIGLIIPFVLFYHPHIGPVRNAKWDTSAAALKGILTFVGYLAAIAETLTYLNFGDVFFILT